MNNAKVTVAKLPKSKVELTVEIESNEFATFAEKALEEIAKEAEISGFRKGAAPKDMVKSRVGSAKILDRAAMMAIEATFPQAIADNKLEPLGYPEVRITKIAEGNPLEYKAAVAVYPQITLPDYKQIAGEFKMDEVKVTEEEISRLKMEKERHMREHKRQDLLAAIATKTDTEVPEVLVERETQKMMEQLKERTPQALNMSFEEYLKKLGKTEEELAQAMAKDNEAKIKNYLVLQEISKAVAVEVSDAEVEKAYKGASPDEAADPSKMTDQDKEYFKENLKMEKTFEALEGFYKKA
jgi:FKBP-type peptidyl-prolyl cis-trans isomerase (trigger factor)